jgi:peptidoglycan/xylan/chitin deacetylase (PgdA/CDA1 family)
MTLVPDDFEVPIEVHDGEWHLEAITIHHVLRDFESYLASRDHLERRMAEIEPDWDWPPGLTLEDDLAEMGWHQGEFRRRTSFAYMLLTDDGTRSRGCVYLFPTEESHDARLDFWVTAGEYDAGLEPRLVEFLRRWLRDAWPFQGVLWPSRFQ